MYHFFVQNDQIEDSCIRIREKDYKHAVNVLRLRKGEEVMVSDLSGQDYYCLVDAVLEEQQELLLSIGRRSEENHELPARITLYQSLPKSDKMELIIQKATELGVTRIVPVESRNCVMKLEPKKAESRISRWQAIAEAAAKQSKRSRIPEVTAPLSFTGAVKQAAAESSVKIIPYENENGMIGTCEAIIQFLPGADIAVFVGPEGGYDPLEIRFADSHGITPVSLGKRILRAETAAMAILSLIMIRLEIAATPGVMEDA